MSDPPQTQPPSPPGRRRLVVRVLIAALALAVLAAIAIHLPPVRAAVLRYALRTAQESFGVRIDAERLDYNLATLRARLTGVRVSRVDSPGAPFFAADAIDVAVPWRTLLGDVAFDEIAVTGAAARIVRDTAGRTNLPEPAARSGSGEPAALRIGTLRLPNLRLQIEDAQADVHLDIPDMSLLLAASNGRARLNRPAELRVGANSTRIRQFDGGLAFDGRDLLMNALRILTDEGRAEVSGTLALLRATPSIEVAFTAGVDAARAARWGSVADPPSGVITVNGRSRGAFADLRTELEAASDRLEWRRLPLDRVRVRATLTPAALDVLEAAFEIAGGRVTGTAAVPLGGGAIRAQASWSDVDAAALAARLGNPDIVPAGRIEGELQASGDVDRRLSWRADGRLAVAPSAERAGTIAIPGQTTFALADGRWTARGRHRVADAAPVEFALTGRLGEGDVDTWPIGGTIAVPPTDVQTLTRVVRRFAPSAPGDNDVRGTLTASADVGGTVGRPRLDFRTNANSLAIMEQPIAALMATGRVDAGTLRVDEFAVEQSAAGDRGQITGTLTYTFAPGRYEITTGIRGWRIDPTEDLPLTTSIDGTLDVSGQGTALSGTGEVTLRDTVASDYAVGDVRATLRLEGERAHIDATAPDFQVAATADIATRSPYPATVVVRSDRLDLARVLRGVETPTPITGTAAFEARGEGPLASWRQGMVDLRVESIAAAAGDLDIRLSAPAHVTFAGDRLVVDRFEADAGGTHLSATGAVLAGLDGSAAPPTGRSAAAPAGDALLVTATGDVGEAMRAAISTGLTSAPIADAAGPFALLARVTGTLTKPVVAADLEVGPASATIREGVPPLTDVRVQAQLQSDVLTLRSARAAFEGAAISADGSAPLALLTGASATADVPARLTARVTGVTPRVLAAFVDPSSLQQVEGLVDASLVLETRSTDLQAATGELTLDRFDLSLSGLPVTQRTPTRITLADGFARVRSWEWSGEGATLSVQGQVRLSDRQAAILADGALDLRMLTPFVRAAGITTAGRLEPRLSITGTLLDPRIDGSAAITGGEVRLASPRVIASDLDGRAVLTRTSAHLVSLTGSLNGGMLTGSGQADYNPADGRLSTTLSAYVAGMALDFPEGLRTESDATIGLTLGFGPGDVPPTGRLSGSVTLLRGAYRDPLPVIGGLLTSLRARAVAADVQPSPLLDALQLDVRLVTDDDLIVDNNVARIQLGADVRVIGTASMPALSGRAELQEGGQLFLGRNVYTVQNGVIDFANPVAIEPDLDVTATTRAGGETIEVHLSGTPENLTTDLSSPTSDTPLGQADLVAMLLTGRRLDELSTDEAAAVGAQVLGNLSGDVLGFASRAVGLDVLRLGGVETEGARRDPSAIATEVDPTSRLTFGKSLGRTFDITYSQSLRDSSAQTWILDYQPKRQVALRFVQDDDDLRSYQFRHDVSFGEHRVAAAAQERPAREPSEPPRIARVVMTGELVFPEADLREVLRQRDGDRFDFVAWQNDRDRLERFYRERRHLQARIAATRGEAEGGVTLVYSIDGGPETRISITGAELDAATVGEIEEAWGASVFDGFLIDETRQIVGRALARRGFVQPMTDVALTMDESVRTLAIAITPGTRIDRTIVAASVDQPAEEMAIDEWLRQIDASATAVASPDDLRQRTTDYLHGRGFTAARVSVGRPSFEGSTATVPLTVVLGPRLTFGDIAIAGNALLTTEQLRNIAAIEPGAAFEQALVEQAEQRLVALYRREAFASAIVDARGTPRAGEPVVDVTFAITEGPRQVVAEVVVAGNRATDADVITRALQLETGQALRADDWLQARRRVFDTGLFRRVNAEIEPLAASADGAEQPMRIRVDVEEWPALRLRYGFEVAEEHPESEPTGRDLVPGLSADVTRRTLFGRAITLGGAFDYQRRERRGRAFINAPTLLSMPVQSSLVLERAREEFAAATLVTDTSTIAWEQRSRPTRRLELSYSYRFEKNHTFDTEAVPGSEFGFDITVNVARITAAGAWDTRDDAGDSTRGTLITGTLEYGPKALGSDFRFVRHLAQAYRFTPWRGVVFASAARFGVVTPLGGQELIPSLRFFVGGARTVRGVEEDSLGPRDFFGDPAGGEGLLALNQEVRFPIYKWLRGVTFVDAGNVFPRPGDIRFRELAASVGFGFRLATPVALLRVDYGQTFWPEVNPQPSRWVFGIGQAF